MEIASGCELRLVDRVLKMLSNVSLEDMVSRYDHSAENERVNLTAKNISKRYMERYGKKAK